MADFEVLVVRVTKVEDHPNADRLSLVYFREYRVISAKLEDGSHRYKEGDLVVYCPEGAIVPEYLLRQGFWNEEKGKGILSGKNGDIVKAVKLRDIISQGIMFPVKEARSSFDLSKRVYMIQNDLYEEGNNDPARREFMIVKEGDNVAEFLGIKKHVPEIPTSMSGDTVHVSGIPKFDIENIKKYPDLISKNDIVEVTEKLHGTFMGIGRIPGIENENFWEDHEGKKTIFCYSKGLGSKGIVFIRSEENLIKNVYAKALEENIDGVRNWFSYATHLENDFSTFIYGEVTGKGIQDLAYDQVTKFRVFDVITVRMGQCMSFASQFGLMLLKSLINIDTVPVLYRGLFNEEVRLLRDGKSTLSEHIREGIVIRKITGMNEPVVLKDVSDAYLTRKNATEYQ